MLLFFAVAVSLRLLHPLMTVPEHLKARPQMLK
jgi:hypothetical protein